MRWNATRKGISKIFTCRADGMESYGISKGAMKLKSFLLKSTVVAALGGLLFGFDTAVIAGTTHALTETFHLSPAALGMTVSAALWGTILGSMLAGIPGD